MVKRCPLKNRATCEVCKSPYHHTIRHEYKQPCVNEETESSTQAAKSNKAEEVKNLSTVTHAENVNRKALFQTATAILTDDHSGKIEKVRVVFDKYANRKYIRRDKSSLFNMAYYKENLSISGFEGIKGGVKTRIIRHERIVSAHDHNVYQDVDLIEVDTITNPLITQPIPEHFLNHRYVKGLQFAEDYEMTNNEETDILIGLDYYWDFITGRVRKQKGNQWL